MPDSGEVLALAFAVTGVMGCVLVARLVPTPHLLGGASRRATGIRLVVATLVLPPSALIALLSIGWVPGLGMAHAVATLYVFAVGVIDGVAILRGRIGSAPRWVPRPHWLGPLAVAALTTIALFLYPWVIGAWAG